MTSQTSKIFLLLFYSIPLFGVFEKDLFTIGTYNVENLFENSVVDPNRNPLELLPNQRLVEPVKSIIHLKGVARAIQETNFDILVVEEIENLAAMQKLNHFYLNNQYDAYLIEGNDPRGIDVGFFVRKGLPFTVEEKTNKTEMWEDPTNNNKKQKLFSRDLPELYVRPTKDAAPLFVLLGTHYKSKIDRPHDKESRILRKAQVERTTEVIRRIEVAEGGATPILLSGDFNGEATHEPEFVSLHGKIMNDAFDLVQPALSKAQRITHLYFPKGKPFERSQLDAVYTNKYMERAIHSGQVYRYKDAAGKELPIPNTFEEKKANPSDHYPVVVKLKLSELGW